MTKVKVFTGFAFVPKPPRKPKIDNKKCTNIVYCICQEVEGQYYAYVNLKEDKRQLEFTKESADLKGKLIVFTKKLDKNNKPICIYRSELDARLNPGLSTQYTPFCNNYIYSGHIVKRNGRHYFDVKECIGPYSNYASLVNEKIKLYED